MQASSDYWPSRVLMLLNALLNRIPRNFASTEFRGEGASGWKANHVTAGGLPLVCVSKGHGDQRVNFTEAFYFLPQGLLVLRNEEGVITGWENNIAFAGKAVPRHLTIKTGEREMLTADLTLEAAGQFDQSTLDLPGGPAQPGMTLRPLDSFELRLPEPLDDSWSWVEPGLNTTTAIFSIWGVLNRQDRYRELEVMAMHNPNDEGTRDSIRTQIDHLRDARHRPPEIDGSPTEFVIKRTWM